MIIVGQKVFRRRRGYRLDIKRVGFKKLNYQINCDKIKIKEVIFIIGVDFFEFEGLWMNFYFSILVLEGRLQRGFIVYIYKRFRDLEY